MSAAPSELPGVTRPRMQRAGSTRLARAGGGSPPDAIGPHFLTSAGDVVLVDADMLPLLAMKTWTGVTDKNGKRRVRHYWVDETGAHSMGLPRFIMNAGPADLVDHRNGDTLDNRRANLRICTPQQNMGNKARARNCRNGFKGLRRHHRRWHAVVQGRTIGTFSTAEEAARAYDAHARRVFGEFACVNFPAAGERQA